VVRRLVRGCGVALLFVSIGSVIYSGQLVSGNTQTILRLSGGLFSLFSCLIIIVPGLGKEAK